ncbi:MAG: helix-turn-helix domain-containing protein, partial [Corynebacterium sp.]|nr:helix-turn-helix domain-containing protein [Corynebacterium sp.]
MTATKLATSRVSIDDRDVHQLRQVDREVDIESNDSLALHKADGRTVQLPESAKKVLLQAIKSLAHSGEVTIGRVPDELTSNTAADILGVSRTTLLKWAKDEKVPSFKVGSHTRFKREDIFHLRSKRAEERRKAFDKLRQFEWEN